MPPPPIVDPSTLDLTRIVATREEIYAILPHRFEFMQLDAICHVDPTLLTAYREVRPDEWWCKGHIPGRPVLPGVLMIESAAHVAAYCYHRTFGQESFMGFSAVDKFKFRGAVTPPCRLVLVCRPVEVRTRRTICEVQGFVGKTMVFEGVITGMPI